MADFINLIERGQKVQIKTKDMLAKFNRLPFNYQSKIEYDTLTQNVNPKELINIINGVITDMDIELKMKIIRIKYLETK